MNGPHKLLLQVVTFIFEETDDTRPITVASLAYQLSATPRAKNLAEEHEEYARPSQNGYHRGKRACDPAWAAEYAWLQCSHRVGFSLDLATASDRIPHELLPEIPVHSGLPAFVIHGFQQPFAVSGNFKTAEGLWRSFHVTHGLPQGDA